MTWRTKRYGGTNASRHRMRCSRGKLGCGSRFTLKRHPDKYKRPVRCPYCKSLHVVSVEAERRREQLNEDTCHCHAYPFPHRSGSLRMCVNHPNDAEPTDEEIAEYEGVIATPRSGFM